jgi:hypothetical protein
MSQAKAINQRQIFRIARGITGAAVRNNIAARE